MKKIGLIIFLIVPFIINAASPVLLDNYDGIGGLAYTTEGTGTNYWEIVGNEYIAKTGGSSEPNHSYASYDLSNYYSNWTLSKSKELCWCGWMDLNRSSVSGWGASSYSCGMVLASNSSDFNETTTNGYAVGFNSDDKLVVFRFSSGIVGGTAALPGESTLLVDSGYTYNDSDNGVNFYIEFLSDGKWKIYYKAGEVLSDVDALDKTKYNGGNQTSISADETYSGTNYKYAGWIYAHSSGDSELAYFDNFGAGGDQSLPVTLSSFSTTINNGLPELYWTTESELENMGWNVYRSNSETGMNDNNYLLLNSELIPGMGTTSVPTNYSFTDEYPITETGTYWYWLQSVSYSGELELFGPVSLLYEPGGNSNLPLLTKLNANYPNPFNPQTTIEFSIETGETGTLTIFSVTGQKVLSKEFSEGNHLFIWHAEEQSSGVYFYKLQTSRYQKTRKMILLK